MDVWEWIIVFIPSLWYNRYNYLSMLGIKLNHVIKGAPGYWDPGFLRHQAICKHITHWGQMTHICVDKLTIIGSDNGLAPRRRQAIIWTSSWNIANWTLANKLQRHFYWNSNIFIQENAFENVVCQMAAILSRPQCDNWLHRLNESLPSPRKIVPIQLREMIKHKNVFFRFSKMNSV